MLLIMKFKAFYYNFNDIHIDIYLCVLIIIHIPNT